MAAQHTPGPWRTDDHYHGAILGDGNQVAMATMNGCLPAETRDANARLIAAAPELLEALQQALFSLGHTGANHDLDNMHRPAWEMIRAAIAKATGGA
jgi:hypothetical protein